MAAVAFDSLEYAHQLEAAGMPRAQAVVIAQGLTSMSVHNFDSLVTKESRFETEIFGAKARCVAVEQVVLIIACVSETISKRLAWVNFN
jgi:hypothetical protein